METSGASGASSHVRPIGCAAISSAMRPLPRGPPCGVHRTSRIWESTSIRPDGDGSTRSTRSSERWRTRKATALSPLRAASSMSTSGWPSTLRSMKLRTQCGAAEVAGSTGRPAFTSASQVHAAMPSTFVLSHRTSPSTPDSRFAAFALRRANGTEWRSSMRYVNVAGPSSSHPQARPPALITSSLARGPGWISARPTFNVVGVGAMPVITGARRASYNCSSVGGAAAALGAC